MKRTTGSMITFSRPDGKDVQGYLASPHKQRARLPSS